MSDEQARLGQLRVDIDRLDQEIMDLIDQSGRAAIATCHPGRDGVVSIHPVIRRKLHRVGQQMIVMPVLRNDRSH